MSAKVNGIPASATDRVSTSRVVARDVCRYRRFTLDQNIEQGGLPCIRRASQCDPEPFPQGLSMWRSHAITQCRFKVSQGLCKTLRQAADIVLIVEIENRLDLCGQTQQLFAPALHLSRQAHRLPMPIALRR